MLSLSVLILQVRTNIPSASLLLNVGMTGDLVFGFVSTFSTNLQTVAFGKWWVFRAWTRNLTQSVVDSKIPQTLISCTKRLRVLLLDKIHFSPYQCVSDTRCRDALVITTSICARSLLWRAVSSLRPYMLVTSLLHFFVLVFFTWTGSGSFKLITHLGNCDCWFN